MTKESLIDKTDACPTCNSSDVANYDIVYHCKSCGSGGGHNSSEISVDGLDAGDFVGVIATVLASSREGEKATRVYQELRPYLAAPKPVSVEVCAKAVTNKKRAVHNLSPMTVIPEGDLAWIQLLIDVQTVLDAAGVTYVD